MRAPYALAACLALGLSVAPSAPLATEASNPRRTVPLPARHAGRAVAPPTTAPGQSARRKRQLARHGKAV